MGNESFGTYLRKLRLGKRVGLRQFAKAIGILPSNLCHLESGRHGAPQGEKLLKKAAQILGLKEGTKEYERLFNLAAHPGEIPADVKEYLVEHDILEELPVMARTIKNEKLTRAEIERLIEDIKKKNNV